MKHFRIHMPGYRVWKTVIAATLTLLVCSQFSEMSPVLALMGVYCAMGKTIKESWTGCLSQLVGVIVGSILGFLLLHLLPNPPWWLIGLSLLVVIGLCNLLHISYAVFLSSVIYISVCTGDSQLPDVLARIRDVSIGLAFGLAVNIVVHPYSNERKVLLLLEQLQRRTLQAAGEIVAFGRYPDLRACSALREKLEWELEQTRQQVFVLRKRRYRDLLAWEGGCIQLAERMLQEVLAVCSMDSFGAVSEENIQWLVRLGAPDMKADAAASSGAEEDVVMNYHLSCFCRAYECLTELLPLGEAQAPSPQSGQEPEPPDAAEEEKTAQTEEEKAYETAGS